MAEKALTCSFCGKAQQHVVKLIAGPGVYICNECVDLCAEIIEHEVGEDLLDTEIQAATQAAHAAVDRLRVLAQQGRAVRKDDDPDEAE